MSSTPPPGKKFASTSDTHLLIQSRLVPKSPGGDSAGSAPIEGEMDFLEEKMVVIEEEEFLKGKHGGEAAEVIILEPSATGGFISSSVNLLKTIIGAGMLSLPFAFSLVGILPGSFLLCLATVMSIFGLYLLAKASHQVCHRTGSFAALSKVSYPKLSPLFDGAVALKCLGVSIGYLKIIGDLLPETIRGFQSGQANDSAWYLNRIVLVSVIVAAISPVTFMKRMDSLKYTSFLGLLSVLYLLVLSVIMWIQTMRSTGSVFGYGSAVAKLTPSSFRSFPIMVFAFTCHQNLFPIQNEAKKNSPRDMLTVINTCLSISLLTYLIFATGSYATFNSDPVETPINANIINNYPTKGVQFIIARFLYIFLLTFSFPIVVYPTRESIFKIIEFFFPNFYIHHKKKIFFTTIVAIVLFTWLIACINPPLDFVLGLIGSTVSPVICFFLPAIFWLKIDPSLSKKNPLRVGCVALIVFAVISTALSLTSLVISVVQK